MSDNEKSLPVAKEREKDELRHQLAMLDATNRLLSSKLAAAEARAQVWKECAEAWETSCYMWRDSVMKAMKRA